ncbi:hypothetical protein KR054_010361 [Drosophila jambulina]|nr:hypothetical protein KR054_010361 [Drosophila jambulina]
MADLVLTRKDLTSKLETVRYAIRERQDELNTKRLGRKKCEPTPLELAIQIGDETRQQLQDKEEEIRPFYSRRYNKLLEELGQLIRKREKELLDNDPNPV